MNDLHNIIRRDLSSAITTLADMNAITSQLIDRLDDVPRIAALGAVIVNHRRTTDLHQKLSGLLGVLQAAAEVATAVKEVVP